ncbi:MAG: hypothetical protein QG673_369, partial [Pseudomonadota bacterium]|nr:hypothetical protein [Pseudomonadota bacterium]
LKPIINPHDNCVTAISVESRQLDATTYLYKLLMFFEKNKINSSLKIPHCDDKLTLREHEIAFLLLYYKSPKKIATILNNLSDKPVSAKTISNIISGGLYHKLNVYGIDALIEKLYLLQYQNKIPVSFLINLHLELA